jgi:hypothetical protein
MSRATSAILLWLFVINLGGCQHGIELSGRTDQVNHGNLAYSACASFRTRMFGSAFFHSVKRSL